MAVNLSHEAGNKHWGSTCMYVGTMFQLVRGNCLLYLLAAVSAAGAPLHFSTQQEWLDVPIPSAADGQIALSDVNGDGKADIVFYNADRGRAWVALSTGRSFQAPVEWCFGLPTTSAEVQFTVADVNGDGKADFIAFVHGDGQSAGSANVYVALSTGAGFQYPQQPVWNAGFCIAEQVCKVADVNGDGKADLIVFTPRLGLVWVSLSTGASFGANAVWNRYFCLVGEVCETGDVGGTKKSGLVDGKADLLQTDVLSIPTGGGGSRITKSIYWVHLTTDKTEPPPPPAPAPVPRGGVKEVNIYNCGTDQHRLYYAGSITRSSWETVTGPSFNWIVPSP